MSQQKQIILMQKDDAFYSIELVFNHWEIFKFTPEHHTHEDPAYHTAVGDNIFWVQALISILKNEGWNHVKQ